MRASRARMFFPCSRSSQLIPSTRGRGVEPGGGGQVLVPPCRVHEREDKSEVRLFLVAVFVLKNILLVRALTLSIQE